jgi:hypothetical protein
MHGRTVTSIHDEMVVADRRTDQVRLYFQSHLTLTYGQLPAPPPSQTKQTERAMKEADALKRGGTLYLWRLALHYTPSADRTHLIFLIHHAISDGDSILRLLQVSLPIYPSFCPSVCQPASS